jgi:hypothetical protein
MDADLALDCFLPDAELDYGRLYRGSPAGFVEWLWPVHARMVGHVHSVSNVLIEASDDGTAVSETYVRVTLRMQLDDGLVDMVGLGRYLDEWRRQDRWRISRRQYVSDLGSTVAVGGAAVGGVLTPKEGGLAPSTPSRDRSDPSYRLFPA